MKEIEDLYAEKEQEAAETFVQEDEAKEDQWDTSGMEQDWGEAEEKMKTAREKITAREYVAPNGVDFRLRTDRFTHVTRSRVKIASSSNGSSRRGGGFSGSKGKF